MTGDGGPVSERICTVDRVDRAEVVVVGVVVVGVGAFVVELGLDSFALLEHAASTTTSTVVAHRASRALDIGRS